MYLKLVYLNISSLNISGSFLFFIILPIFTYSFVSWWRVFQLHDFSFISLVYIANPLSDTILGLTAEQILKYAAIIGLSICFLVILNRPSKVLWSIFGVAALLSIYLEFSSVGDVLRNLTVTSGDGQNAFSGQNFGLWWWKLNVGISNIY